MSDPIPITRWIGNWRGIAEAVPYGVYQPVTAERDGQSYEILRISAYDPEVDGDRRVVRTAAREFDNKVALFTHLTRDIGLVRVILVRGQPRWVLEPGADSLEWIAVTEGVSVRELTQAASEGGLGRRVARLARLRGRRSREALEARVQALRERAEDAEAEAAQRWAELRAREHDLARFGAA